MIGKEYELSGKVDASLAWKLPLAMLGAALAAALYMGIVYINPFIYLNFLALGGIGFVMLLLGGAIAEAGKIRNGAIAVLAGLLVGLAGYYASWVTFVLLIAEPPFAAALSPVLILDVAGRVLDYGWYSIGSMDVSGVLLGGIWLIDAGVCLLAPVFASRAHTTTSVFCEDCDRWAKEEEGVLRFEHDDAAGLAAGIRAGQTAIFDAARPVQNADAYFRVDAEYCEGCDALHALSLRKAALVTDKEGNTEEQVGETIFEDVLVSREFFAHAARSAAPEGA